MVLLALLHALVSAFLLHYFAGTAGASPIWIPAGIGLGALLIYGYRYWPFIFVGATLGEMGGGHELFMAMQLAAGAVIGFLAAVILLRRFTSFNPKLKSLRDYFLLLIASGLAALLSAFINTQFLLTAGLIPVDVLQDVSIHWFIGDFFGMAFFTPAILVLRGPWYQSWSVAKKAYLLLSLMVAVLIGQAIFFGWLESYVDLTGWGNFYFVGIIFMGLYFGRQGAMLFFCLIVTQSILGALSGAGFFGLNMMTKPGSVPIWLYLAALCMLGLTVAFVIERLAHQNQDLSDATKQVEKSEVRFREIVAKTPALMATYDPKTQETDYVNPHFTSVLGYVRSDFSAPNGWWSVAYPDPVYRQEVEAEWSRRDSESQKTGAPFVPFETKTTCKNGTVRLINWGRYFAADRMVIYGTDITDQKRAEELLRLTSAVYLAMGEAVVIQDAHNSILMVNEAFENLTGYSAKDLSGKSFSEFVVKSYGSNSYSDIYASLEAVGRWEGRAWIQIKSGEEILKFVSVYSALGEDGLLLQRVVLIADVTDQRKSRELINRQANFDSLTGLLNRRSILSLIDRMIAQSIGGGNFVVLYVDLDNFKDINDSRGHDFGDELLVEIADRLKSVLGHSDGLARINSDEFVVLLANSDQLQSLDGMVEDIFKKVTSPIVIQGEMIHVTASMGIASYADDGADSKELLLRADQAVRVAKAQGKNNYQHYIQLPHANIPYRAGVIAELRDALINNKLVLQYQPITDLKTGKILHAEALIRMRKADGELVLPSSFIQVAEDSGLIVEIGDWVWNEALKFLGSFPDPLQFTLAINVAPSQFSSHQHSVTHWLELLRQHQISPQSIVIELTERMILLQSDRVLKKIATLQEAGCKFSVDDFGTGYSSLATLKRFNFDYIKIDADFIRQLSDERQDLALVSAILSMAQSLELEAIAEGVETEAQARALTEMGCTFAQGYLYSRPLYADEFKQLLSQQST